MKVFLKPKGLHSRAMVRIADALAMYCPYDVADSESDADLSVLYVIGTDYIDRAESLTANGQKYAVVQCCLKTAGQDNRWVDFWSNSTVLWSYYDMGHLYRGDNYYYAPLGIDKAFHGGPGSYHHDRDTVITTGYVSGPGAEAISEVWHAATLAGIRCVHVGPANVHGAMVNSNVTVRQDISDEELLSIYRSALYVSGLRYCEGFELPGVEGLACGARPVLFNQPDQIHWFGSLATFVDENSSDLTADLHYLFRDRADVPVSDVDRFRALCKFDWKIICGGFWDKVGRQGR